MFRWPLNFARLRNWRRSAKSAGRSPQPVTLSGRAIASTFWGKAWCDNLETWKDYDNRLSRGVTYLRNGSVVDLHITKRKVEAIVAGSEPYHIHIQLTQLPDIRWKKLAVPAPPASIR
ncbi:MAG UNVERIFIED_CONTAM: hypothetical protein LVR18_41235 [Planctomycetaceae bacterium]|jgi:uncharacterized Zn finger protein